MPNPETLKELFDAAIHAGITDGITGKNEYTVDGLPFSREIDVYSTLFNLVHGTRVAAA